MKTLFTSLALSLLVFAVNPASAQYRYYEPRPYDAGPRAGVVVHPRAVPYFDDYSNYYPAVRGFEDRNSVPRGNIRGCSVDLGYGRYESCDK